METVKKNTHASLSEIHESIDTTRHKKPGWRNLLSFLGPAYLISVGYMDPGNWATDLSGGSQFGYSLIWVLMMSNLMALLLQGLSARLGIVRGKDLAQANREAYPPLVNFMLYIFAEIAIAACDLAEVLGMAIGIQLLTGLPLIWGVSITVLDTFLLLYLQKLGMRKMEAFIITLVGIVSISFLIEIIFAKPPLGEIALGFLPHKMNGEALYIAIGIIGATVMPHNLYLHSSLVQTRKIDRSDAGIAKAIKYNRIDSAIALNIAFLVNAAILILAATIFFKTGHSGVAEIKKAYQLLQPLLGNKIAPFLFAIALIAAGQSSTITGTLAGQIVMEGYLNLRINPWVRRLITRLLAIVPALIVILVSGEKNVYALLILSQVILSIQLGFAIIPLIHFVSDRKKMGKFTIKPITLILSWAVAALLVFLNVKMLVNQAADYFNTSGFPIRLLFIMVALIFLALLVYIIVHPFITKYKGQVLSPIHTAFSTITSLDIPEYKNIAIALDFTESDKKVLENALGQGDSMAQYSIVHVVESVTASLLGHESDDLETRKDQERLDAYVEQLTRLGYQVKGYLGFKDRAHEIIRIVGEIGADMLVVGAHRHTGYKDFIYGETVNSVRHKLKIPILVVNI